MDPGQRCEVEGPATRVRFQEHRARWFRTRVHAGVFGTILEGAALLVEKRGEYRLYECFIDGAFSKAVRRSTSESSSSPASEVMSSPSKRASTSRPPDGRTRSRAQDASVFRQSMAR